MLLKHIAFEKKAASRQSSIADFEADAAAAGQLLPLVRVPPPRLIVSDMAGRPIANLGWHASRRRPQKIRKSRSRRDARRIVCINGHLLMLLMTGTPHDAPREARQTASDSTSRHATHNTQRRGVTREMPTRRRGPQQQAPRASDSLDRNAGRARRDRRGQRLLLRHCLALQNWKRLSASCVQRLCS